MTSMKNESEILQSLELIHPDTMVAIGEEYVPIGEIAKQAALHIRFLREHINVLEVWRYGG